MEDYKKTRGSIVKGNFKSVLRNQGKHLRELDIETNKMSIQVVAYKRVQSPYKTPSGFTECDRGSVWG